MVLCSARLVCVCVCVCVCVQPFSHMVVRDVCLGSGCRILVADNGDKLNHFIVSCDISNSCNIISTRGCGLLGMNISDSIPPKHRYCYNTSV